MKSLLALLFVTASLPAADWPQWRGPRMDGTSSETGFPSQWSATENVAWKTELPGSGHASIIVCKGRLFTVAAVVETEERLLICLDRKDGKILWQQVVFKAPIEREHRENSPASSTPATDGERVFCSFLEDPAPVVAAYDFSGKQLWLKKTGTFSSVHGFTSTPIIYKDKVIVNCDQDGDGYIVALARTDGRELWRIDRPNKKRSYCTPIIRDIGGHPQMVLSGTQCVASYNPDTGALLWTVDGPTDQFVASPSFSEKTGFFYVSGGFPEHHVVAIKPDGTGNVTASHIVWHHAGAQGVAYVPSPIIEGDWLLLNDDAGFAHAYDAKSGEIVWKERFARTHASLVSAGGLVYFLDDKGVCRVVKPADKFAVIATNELGEETYATPALSDGQIFLRGSKHVFCVGKF